MAGEPRHPSGPDADDFERPLPVPAVRIRDAVIHLLNEQPLVADLFAHPAPSDVALLCTNLRTQGGKRPVFVDRSDSTFVFPLAHVRFVEIPPPAGTSRPPGVTSVPSEADLEIDEDFLRRVREA